MTMKKLSIRAWKTYIDMNDDMLRDQLLEIRQVGLRRIAVLCDHAVVNHILKVVS